MIELQILNKILKTKSIGILILNNIDLSYFQDYQDEFVFIFDHYKKYKTVPDEETFFDKFPDVDSIIVSESDDYLIATLKENHVYATSVPIINKVIELAETDANAAVEYLASKAPELIRKLSIEGVDIIKYSNKRFDVFKTAKDLERTRRIRVLLKELDDLLFGGFLAGEELVTVMARPNQGKSWIMELIGAMAWTQNIPVLFYSGEMTANIVGYRVDTLLSHFSNTDLMTGLFQKPDEFKRYEDFVGILQQSEVPFIVVTRKDLGGKATVSKLDALVEKYGAGILIVDQYSLMLDERHQKGDQKRDNFGHITDDLMGLSIKHGIPVIGASQASRGGVKKSAEEGESLTPELEHCAESDQIVQNSSRVLSIRQTDEGLEICKRKDRYFGRIDDSIFYRWDIDKGEFKNIPSSGDTREASKYRKPMQRPDLGDGSDVF